MLRAADELMTTKLAKMPPLEAAAYRSFYETMRKSLNDGSFTADDIVRLASGDRTVLAPILDEARARLADSPKSRD